MPIILIYYILIATSAFLILKHKGNIFNYIGVFLVIFLNITGTLSFYQAMDLSDSMIVDTNAKYFGYYSFFSFTIGIFLLGLMFFKNKR